MKLSSGIVAATLVFAAVPFAASQNSTYFQYYGVTLNSGQADLTDINIAHQYPDYAGDQGVACCFSTNLVGAGGSATISDFSSGQLASGVILYGLTTDSGGNSSVFIDISPAWQSTAENASFDTLFQASGYTEGQLITALQSGNGWQFGFWLLNNDPAAEFTLGTSNSPNSSVLIDYSNGVQIGTGSNSYTSQTAALPESGSAIAYLLLALSTCFAGMILSRQDALRQAA